MVPDNLWTTYGIVAQPGSGTRPFQFLTPLRDHGNQRRLAVALHNPEHCCPASMEYGSPWMGAKHIQPEMLLPSDVSSAEGQLWRKPRQKKKTVCVDRNSAQVAPRGDRLPLCRRAVTADAVSPHRYSACKEPDERVRRPVATQIVVGHLESCKRLHFHREIGLYLAISGCRALLPEPHSPIRLNGTPTATSAWLWHLESLAGTIYFPVSSAVAGCATGAAQRPESWRSSRCKCFAVGCGRGSRKDREPERACATCISRCVS